MFDIRTYEYYFLKSTSSMSYKQDSTHVNSKEIVLSPEYKSLVMHYLRNWMTIKPLFAYSVRKSILHRNERTTGIFLPPSLNATKVQITISVSLNYSWNIFYRYLEWIIHFLRESRVKETLTIFYNWSSTLINQSPITIESTTISPNISRQV